VPTDMDGRVLTELFATPPAVEYVDPLGPLDGTPGDTLSDDDERAVTERLRALGYMT
jgi:hypothetical protein